MEGMALSGDTLVERRFVVQAASASPKAAVQETQVRARIWQPEAGSRAEDLPSPQCRLPCRQHRCKLSAPHANLVIECVYGRGQTSSMGALFRFHQTSGSFNLYNQNLPSPISGAQISLWLMYNLTPHKFGRLPATGDHKTARWTAQIISSPFDLLMNNKRHGNMGGEGRGGPGILLHVLHDHYLRHRSCSQT